MRIHTPILRIIWVIATCFAFSPQHAQGILDTFSPPSNDTVINVNAHVDQQPIHSYSQSAFLEDSLALVKIHDSFKKKWTIDDTLPQKKSAQVDFPKWSNIELKKKQSKPILITILFLLIVGGYVLKSVIYKNKTKMEYRAILRPIYYREWVQDQQDTLSFYVLYSKVMSLLLVGLFCTYLGYRLNIRIFERDWMTTLIIFLTPSVLVGIKYIGAVVLSYLFAKPEMFRHHFTYNQLVDNFFFLPLLVCFILSYFMNGVWDIKIFIVLGLILLLISRVISTLFFVFQTLFDAQYKKLYVIFYLCSLEIMPTVILIRWIAKNYT